MPKISELNNEQLEKMIEKHSRILQKLIDEKDKRYPERDLNEDLDLNISDSAYQLNLEAEGINQEEIEKNEELKGSENNMIRVTRLLKLTPEQISELNEKNTKKKKKKKKSKPTP